MSTLELSQIRKSYGATEIIHGVDLDINEGEFVVFVGPSGCGKSTMLRMIAGLEPITCGQLLINGQLANEMAPVDRGVAMVFQSYALYPNMTVRKNLSFGLEQIKLPKTEIKRLVSEVAELLQITDLLDRRPGELSGGQSQRVAIGRAIVRDPKIFLFDEPLSNLDAELRVHMRVEIKALHARLKRTTIYVTHDQVEAMTMADRIIVFRDGRIEQIGSPLELYNTPVSKFVAGFIGSPHMNFIDVMKDSNGELDFTALNAFNSNVQDKDMVTAGLRPEHMKLCPSGGGWFDARVVLTEQLGGEAFIYLKATDASQQLVAKMIGQSCPIVGDTVGIDIPDDLIYQFDPSSGACLKSPIGEMPL